LNPAAAQRLKSSFLGQAEPTERFGVSVTN